MGTRGWDDVELEPVGDGGGRYTAVVADRWQLLVVPQGGIVAVIAAQAMAAELAVPEQALRTMSVVFAGQVACGPVDVDVTVLRRGRSMSQLSATVRNPGAKAGLTAIAVFGAPRRGFEFTELDYPEVESWQGLRGYRDPLPDGVEFEFDRPPMPFWEEVIECRPAKGNPPWDWHPGPAEVIYWYRMDDPSRLDDGRIDPLTSLVLCDTMPGAVGQKLGPDSGNWFGPSADFTIHLFGASRSDWMLAHNRARFSGDGYASVDMALWDPSDRRLIAYATQVMFYAFGI